MGRPWLGAQVCGSRRILRRAECHLQGKQWRDKENKQRGHWPLIACSAIGWLLLNKRHPLLRRCSMGIHRSACVIPGWVVWGEVCVCACGQAGVRVCVCVCDAVTEPNSEKNSKGGRGRGKWKERIYSSTLTSCVHVE